MSLQVGNKAPDFELDAVKGQEFKKIKLSDLQKEGKWTVLFRKSAFLLPFLTEVGLPGAHSMIGGDHPCPVRDNGK